MLFWRPCARVLGAVRRSAFPILTGGLKMDIKELQGRLRSLGWKACELGLQDDGRWVLCVSGCGHIVYAMGNTRCEAWSAACSTAIKLALDGDRPEPQPESVPSLAPDNKLGETEMDRLIAEYESLCERSRCLFHEWNEIDQRMVEIERVLPDDYPYRSDFEQ